MSTASGVQISDGRSAAARADLKRRAANLLRQEVEFIPNEEFLKAGAEKEILVPEPLLEKLAVDEDFAKLTRGMQPSLARFCECPLLTAEQERNFFRRLNFLRYRINCLRSKLNEKRPSRTAVERIEALIDEAERVRDYIIRANLRLVISIVRKHIGSQMTFDELLSEGCLSLSQAADKFDYSRGFRFSTYAYRAVSRKLYRAISDRFRLDSRFATGVDSAMFSSVEDESRTLSQDGRNEFMRQLLAQFLDKLDRREQLIIRSRYALGAHRCVRTFQNLGDRLGISKERARQLEQRAVSKLRDMAEEHGLAQLVDAGFGTSGDVEDN